tara:strand:+ start:195 stop:521 length:327 start_codon:yes stop_codon:yes gene_type:complete
MKNSYEILLIVKPNLSQDNYKKIEDTIKSWIEDTGGEILLFDNWGVKELATEFNKNKQGLYIQCQFKSGATTLEEIESNIRVNEDIIRHLTVKLESIMEENKEESVEK